MSLASDTKTVREAILDRLVVAWNLNKVHFGPPRTENTDADFPRAAIRLARLQPLDQTSAIAMVSWRALFEITFVDRVPKGFEEIEHLKIEKAQLARDALMTHAAFENIGYLPQIEGYEFDEERDQGKVWWYSVTVIFSILIEEPVLAL